MAPSLRAFLLAVAAVATLTCVAPARSDAAVITYTLSDVDDLVTGEDLWRYEYLVSDHVFDANVSLSLFFDSLIVAAVRPVATPSADWDPLVLLPAFPGDSFVYDVLALVGGASLASPFVVDVVLTPGGVLPASQLFTITRFDADGGFLEELTSGQTTTGPTTTAPEPSSLLLLGLGLAVVAARRRRTPSTPAP